MYFTRLVNSSATVPATYLSENNVSDINKILIYLIAKM
jgi:hypothetical protein